MSSEKTLTLLQGSVRPFDIVLYDGNDELEDLTGATDATFRVLADPEDASSPIIDIDTDGDLAINISSSKLTGTLSQDDADDLAPGLYVGQVGIKISGSWLYTDPFHVRIKDSFAPTV